MRAALARLLHAAHEDDTLADQRQVRGVEASLRVGHLPLRDDLWRRPEGRRVRLRLRLPL